MWSARGDEERTRSEHGVAPIASFAEYRYVIVKQFGTFSRGGRYVPGAGRDVVGTLSACDGYALNNVTGGL